MRHRHCQYSWWDHLTWSSWPTGGTPKGTSQRNFQKRHPKELPKGTSKGIPHETQTLPVQLMRSLDQQVGELACHWLFTLLSKNSSQVGLSKGSLDKQHIPSEATLRSRKVFGPDKPSVTATSLYQLFEKMFRRASQSQTWSISTFASFKVLNGLQESNKILKC